MGDLVIPKFSFEACGDDAVMVIEGQKAMLRGFKKADPDGQLWAIAVAFAGLHNIEFGLAYLDLMLKGELAAEVDQEAADEDVQDTINYWADQRQELLEVGLRGGFPALDKAEVKRMVEAGRTHEGAVLRIAKIIASSSNEELEAALALATVPIH